MKIIFKSLIKTILITGIFVLVSLFVRFIPDEYTICPFAPPCFSRTTLVTPYAFFEEKFVDPYVIKFNLHRSGHESFMDAVNREQRKLFVGLSIIIFILIFIFIYIKEKRKRKTDYFK